MNFHTVQRDGINHVFPDTIPKKRASRDVVLKILSGLGAITVGWICTRNRYNYLVYANTSNYIILIIIEVIRRLCTLYEEKNHISSRYDEKRSILLKEIVSINKYNLVFLPVAVMITLFAPAGTLYSIETYGVFSWICSLIGVTLLSEIINLKENGIYTALLIEELKGLDYGSGMAHSFFYGYLQLVFSKSCSGQKNFKENVEVYESNNNVKFATKKLYILIPLSAHCPNELHEASEKIENGGNSEEILLNIAGVLKRSYKSTVYKLLPESGGVVYVIAEYATPLRTLFIAMSQNTDEARRYKRYKKEIVTNFYMTLEKLLREDPDCKDLCHLIYFRDIDENGEFLNIDICDLLLERINYDVQKQRF